MGIYKDSRTRTEKNFDSILGKLREAFFLHTEYFQYNQGVTLDRKRLRFLITEATGITYRQGIYALIELLQTRHILIPNPNLEEHQSESNYSRYILNISKIFYLGLEPELIEAIEKIKSQKKCKRQSQLSDYQPKTLHRVQEEEKGQTALILSSESS